MNVAQILRVLYDEISSRAYIRQLEVLDHTATVIKARLLIAPNLFIQVYRNDHFDTTNLVLIHNQQRIYARDKVGGKWHRHTNLAPYLHDFSAEGQRAVDLSEFLNEIETIMASMNLP